MTDKRTLRATLRATRSAAAHLPIPCPPQYLALLRSGLTVAAYVPIGGEADPEQLIAAARDLGCTLALPHALDRVTPLRFLKWNGVLEDGPFLLRQPPADAPEVAPDLILTPLVGFDRQGNRLGQGAGHYDRAFAAHPRALRVGIAYAVQEVGALPADPWDVPLHHVATEKEWITP
jgi:5-formyltetrahydrofolate cyclo-ligase